MDGLTKTLPLLKELRILIVDDSAVVRSVLSKELLRSGVQVTQAENGQQALDIALRKEFDLIITDVEMPCMNGIELCRRLKSDPRTQQIPIVILSSLDSEEDIRKGFLAGASTYITKAQAKESLIETIETVLQKTTFQRGRLILVVDDSSTVRTLVEKGLKEVGFEVVKAENGRAALEILKNERPDLILSDIDMPEMNGEEFCKAVHSDPLLATIPFVVLSANNDRPIMRRMLQIGADSYLVKPFNIDQLVITVEKLLSDKLLLLYKEKERLETEQRLILASITSLCCALEARDAYTRGHSEAVASLAKILPIVLYHHERIDGKGYPEGLKGDRIPLWARITAVGDTYHALTSDRPYRAGMDREKALQIIESASGTQLCPDCVEIFLKMELWAGESGDTVSDRTGGPSDEEPIALPDAAAAPARK